MLPRRAPEQSSFRTTAYEETPKDYSDDQRAEAHPALRGALLYPTQLCDLSSLIKKCLPVNCSRTPNLMMMNFTTPTRTGSSRHEDMPWSSVAAFLIFFLSALPSYAEGEGSILPERSIDQLREWCGSLRSEVGFAQDAARLPQSREGYSERQPPTARHLSAEAAGYQRYGCSAPFGNRVVPRLSVPLAIK